MDILEENSRENQQENSQCNETPKKNTKNTKNTAKIVDKKKKMFKTRYKRHESIAIF